MLVRGCGGGGGGRVSSDQLFLFATQGNGRRTEWKCEGFVFCVFVVGEIDVCVKESRERASEGRGLNLYLWVWRDDVLGCD